MKKQVVLPFEKQIFAKNNGFCIKFTVKTAITGYIPQRNRLDIIFYDKKMQTKLCKMQVKKSGFGCFTFKKLQKLCFFIDEVILLWLYIV